jgi:hypothetical protein
LRPGTITVFNQFPLPLGVIIDVGHKQRRCLCAAQIDFQFVQQALVQCDGNR